MLHRFNHNPTAESRALQIWNILVSASHHRQTLTYKLLADAMGYDKAAGVLANSLGHLAFYCEQHKLPALTALVVNAKTGVPGSGIPVDDESLSQQREKVFRFQWFEIIPPDPNELKEAAAKGRRDYQNA